MGLDDLLAGETSISNLTILIAALTFIVEKFINKKYGLNLRTNGQLLNYILDEGVDKSLIAVPKFALLKQKLGNMFNFRKKPTVEEKEKKDTIPKAKTKVSKPISTENNINFKKEFNEFKKEFKDDVLNEISQIRVDAGLSVVAMQLERDHLLSKIKKVLPDLDYNDLKIVTEKQEEVEEIEEIEEKPDPNALTQEDKDLLIESGEMTQEELDKL